MDSYMNVPTMADQQESIYIRYVRTEDVVLETCRDWWMIGTGEKIEKERFREIRAFSVI